MRQAYGEYDDRGDEYGLVGEQRVEEPPPRDRRLPMVVLSVFLMALFAGGLYFAYAWGTRHPAAVAKSGDGLPLLRADERPTKTRPDQPGGMTIPDQNVSLYNEKPGGPSVEKLLPAPEQPLPRPAAIAAAPAAADAAAGTPAPGTPAGVTAPSPEAASPPTKTAAKAPPAAPKAAAPAMHSPAQGAAPTGQSGPVQVRLASVRTPEAAREEWAKLKHENPDLLGKLTAVAVRADLGEKGIYYRIQAGSFGDAAAAERLCNELKRRNLGCLLAR